MPYDRLFTLARAVYHDVTLHYIMFRQRVTPRLASPRLASCLDARRFFLPPIMIVLIAVFNDFSILSVSTDNVEYRKVRQLGLSWSVLVRASASPPFLD